MAASLALTSPYENVREIAQRRLALNDCNDDDGVRLQCRRTTCVEAGTSG